jgi:hypothetical protein
MNDQGGVDFVKLVWRVGRKVGRTVYAQIDDEPTDNDCLIGVFDTKELAAEAVRAHNAFIASPE